MKVASTFAITFLMLTLGLSLTTLAGDQSSDEDNTVHCQALGLCPNPDVPPQKGGETEPQDHSGWTFLGCVKSKSQCIDLAYEMGYDRWRRIRNDARCWFWLDGCYGR